MRILTTRILHDDVAVYKGANKSERVTVEFCFVSVKFEVCLRNQVVLVKQKRESKNQKLCGL